MAVGPCRNPLTRRYFGSVPLLPSDFAEDKPIGFQKPGLVISILSAS